MRQIPLGSFQCWCAVHLPLPCLPVSSWNCSKCSFKLVLSPVQILASGNWGFELNERKFSAVYMCETAQWGWGLPLTKFGLECEDLTIQTFMSHPIFSNSKSSLASSLCLPKHSLCSWGACFWKLSVSGVRSCIFLGLKLRRLRWGSQESQEQCSTRVIWRGTFEKTV